MSSTSALLLTDVVCPVCRERGTDRLVPAGGIETAEQGRRRAYGRRLGFGMTDAEIEFWIRTGSEEQYCLDGETFYDAVVDTADVSAACPVR
ncbi:MAG TPA: hypothetical protein VIG48_04845 [Jatrophihabitans sp.]|jgi:hypothetical protein